MLASTSHPVHTYPSARLAALSLPGRVHVGLTALEPVRRLPSGVQCIDALLGGGLPRGRISELTGPASSGKTSLLLTLLAATSQRGEVAACVDLIDALHPESVARAGVNLQRLLWVRPPSLTEAARCTELLLQAGGFALVVLDLEACRRKPFDKLRASGKWSNFNESTARAEPFDFAQDIPVEACPELRRRARFREYSDRLLGVAVPRRLRSHVWPRLARAAEQSYTALVILAPHRVAGSFAALSLSLRSRALWRRGAWPLFDGFDTTVLVERNKLGAPGRRIVIRARDSCSSTESFFALPCTIHQHDAR